ncbi:MAG TPA: hypothetical protein VIP77_16465 [Jiangellaceae bacterium]
MAEHWSVSRRTFVRGALAAGGSGLIGAALPPRIAHAAETVITDPDGTVTLVAEHDGAAWTGNILVLDGAGIHRLTLTHVMFTDDQRTVGITSVTKVGAQQFLVEYTTTSSTVSVLGTFMVGLRKARVRWDVSGSAALDPEDLKFSRTVVGGTETYEPVVLWNRDSAGGIPYETTHGVGYAETYPDNRALVRIPQSRPDYSDATWIHAPGSWVDGAPTPTVSVEANIVLGVMRPHAAGVIARDGALGVDLWTDQPFNVWNAGGSKTVKAQVVNGSTVAREVTASWTTWDWSGATTTGSVTATVGARAVWNTTVPVTLGNRDIRVVEVRVSDAGGESAFARTNLAVLSTFTYRAGTDSMFGLANFPWLLRPSTADVAALMRLVGMTWVRTAYNAAPGILRSPGIPPKDLDTLGFLHNVQLGGIPFGGTAAEKTAWADSRVGLCLDAGARYYECGNELNLLKTPPAPSAYVTDGLEPLRAAMTRANATFSVMTHGIGGFDEAWLQGFDDAQGWDHVQVLAYHPGRANYVADYHPPEPWVVDGVRTLGYWNFLGSLSKARDLAQSKGKELWLTEAYASTLPNRWGSDTYRHAAENVLLQLALAKAYDVRCVTWYTLNDTIVHQPMEADPSDIEYHHGLLNRDLSPKPSLLAYATAARFLDEAWCLGWVRFTDPSLRGLLFDSPTGQFSILWTRADGYLLNTEPERRDPNRPDYYRTPQPWEDPWPTKTTVSLPTPAASTTVRELDCLGRETALHTATNSRVDVTLDGSPRLFVGLALDADPA